MDAACQGFNASHLASKRLDVPRSFRLPENRADSSGWTPSPHPAVTQVLVMSDAVLTCHVNTEPKLGKVPPTTLRELQPIPLTRLDGMCAM